MAAGNIQYKTASGQPGFELPAPQGQPEISNPLGAREPRHVLITQIYMQRRSAYRRPDPNSLCPADISDGLLAYFVDDSERTPYGIADLVTWTRTWANVPLRHSAYTSTNVIYPGFLGDNDGNASPRPARAEFTATTRGKIDYEYFLVGAGTAYSDESAIPLNAATICQIRNGTTVTSEVDLLGGGILLTNRNNSDPNTVPRARLPLDPTGGYWGWVTTDTATATSYSLIAEQSTLDHYLGNIWRRATLRVKAR